MSSPLRESGQSWWASLSEIRDRVDRRADTTRRLHSLTDEQFELGLSALAKAADIEDQARPAVDTEDLLVLRKSAC